MRQAFQVVLVLACAWVSRLHAEEPFDYFTNSWAVVGLKDYQDATRITPQNELLLSGNRKLQLPSARSKAAEPPAGQDTTGWLVACHSVISPAERYPL